jgi:putative heme iron utilization protein
VAGAERVAAKLDARIASLAHTVAVMISPVTLARGLVSQAHFACLATLDRETGAPFASLVAIADDGGGRPLLVLSELSEHTKNLRARPESSLLISAEATATMDRPRVTLMGAVRWLAGEEAGVAVARFLAVNPDAQQYAALPGFSPARFEITSVRFVGGFARATTLAVQDYLGPAAR